MSAAERPEARWQRLAAGIAIPQAIMDAAPESPWGFSIELFTSRTDQALGRDVDTPSDAAARDVVRAGTSILDVGCGAGVASLRVADRSTPVTGLDPSDDMLAMFRERAEARAGEVSTLASIWPPAIALAPHDLVLCHHVVYNVGDIEPFIASLVATTRRRLVIEMTARHPLDWLRPLWQELHGWDAPAGPTADDFGAVLTDAGIEAQRTDWSRDHERMVSGVDGLRRRLCLSADRADDLDASLTRHPVPSVQDVSTFVFDRGPA